MNFKASNYYNKRFNANTYATTTFPVDVQCHEECVPMRGCWGTLPDECVECRNYGYKELCVPQCDL